MRGNAGEGTIWKFLYYLTDGNRSINNHRRRLFVKVKRIFLRIFLYEQFS